MSEPSHHAKPSEVWQTGIQRMGDVVGDLTKQEYIHNALLVGARAVMTACGAEVVERKIECSNLWDYEGGLPGKPGFGLSKTRETGPMEAGQRPNGMIRFLQLHETISREYYAKAWWPRNRSGKLIPEASGMLDKPSLRIREYALGFADEKPVPVPDHPGVPSAVILPVFEPGQPQGDLSRAVFAEKLNDVIDAAGLDMVNVLRHGISHPSLEPR